jgi:hypothetical protein
MIGAARVLENHPWTVANRTPGWRGLSGPLARTVRTLTESCSFFLYVVALSTIHLWLFITYIAVVWVVFERSLLVVSNQSALVQMMQTIIQPQTQSLNLQLGVASLWTEKMFRTLILTIRLTSQDGLIQRGDSLWQNIAPGGLSISMLCPQTPIFSSFTLSFNLMSSRVH